MVKCVLLNNSDINELKFRLNKNIDFKDNLLKKSENKGTDFQLLIKYSIKSNYEIHIFGFTSGTESSINTHYLHNYSEDNVIYADLFACKFNTNNNNYIDLPTKEYEDFYMNFLENSGVDNSVDVEESDNEELLEEEDEELKLLTTVKSLNQEVDDGEESLIEDIDIQSDIDSEVDLFSDDEIDLEETHVFVDNNLEPEPYSY